jgi:hypothetical protein
MLFGTAAGPRHFPFLFFFSFAVTTFMSSSICLSVVFFFLSLHFCHHHDHHRHQNIAYIYTLMSYSEEGERKVPGSTALQQSTLPHFIHPFQIQSLRHSSLLTRVCNNVCKHLGLEYPRKKERERCVVCHFGSIEFQRPTETPTRKDSCPNALITQTRWQSRKSRERSQLCSRMQDGLVMKRT